MATAVATRFVYNAFDDMVLPFDGKKYKFPKGRVVEISEHYSAAPDERRRNHESNPQPGALLEATYSPQQMLEILFARHGDNPVQQGCVWTGEAQPTAEEKSYAEGRARDLKIELIEEALSERAQALQKGGRPKMDEHVIRWMREIGYHNDVFNPIKKDEPKTDETAKALNNLAEALKKK
jgi:hypothetical protein